jgi:HPt (histidine-containing phosphotransfer) domain-containing protein
VQAIRGGWPRTRAQPRFLLVSGSPADALPAAAYDCGFAKILQKPVAPEELARAVGAEISGRRHSDNGSGTMRRLLRQELAAGLDRIETMIANRQLRDAAGVVHRMTGGSAMAGETRLEIALRKLEDVLRENPGPEQAAAAWCSARREALDFLCGLRSLQGA